MNRIGLRKVVVFTEALVAFCVAIYALELKDSASILAVGTSIVGLLSAAIYGNVQEHRINKIQNNA